MRLHTIRAFAMLAACSAAALAQSGSVTEYNTGITANSQPKSITTGPDGNLWFTESNKNRIGKITPAGVITEFQLPTSFGSSLPNSITVGPDNALWFTTGTYIGWITTGGKFSSAFPETLGGDATAITRGPDGALWFIDPEARLIGRIDTAGKVTDKFSPGKTSLTSLVTGPDGNLWFTTASPDQVGRITPKGDLKLYPLPAGSTPSGITVGPGGKLWFTETDASKIGSINTTGVLDPPLSVPGQKGPNQIVNGSDGALWFTETSLGRIGRITTGGTFTEFAPPTPNSYPVGITTGPDGAIWFTEAGINPALPSGTQGSGLSKIGTVNTVPAPILTSLNPPSATACGPGFTLLLNGQNFQSNTIGVFGGDPAILSGTGLSTTFLSSIQLGSFVPANLISAPGAAGVYAATPIGNGQFRVSGKLSFQIKSTPVILQVSPDTIVAGANGTQLTVLVSNYVPGVTAVVLGTTILPVVRTIQQGSNIAVTVSVPSNVTTGQVPVSVVNVEAANQGPTPYPVSCSAPAIVTVVSDLRITTPQLPNGTVAVAYPNTTLQASGGVPPYRWTSTGLPGNLTLGTTGVLSGMPTRAGVYQVTVTVTDNTGKSASQPYTLTVNEGLSITTPQLPNGIVNVVYPSTSLQATGGITPYRWGSTGLPGNLTLNTSGTLSGTPTKAGNYQVTVTVTDNTGKAASQNYTLTVNDGLTITTPSLLNGTVGVAYPAAQLQASGGTPPLKWSSTGLPGNLTLSTSGVLSGTPNSPGTFSIMIGVSDNIGQQKVQPYTLTVDQGLSITTPSLPNGTAGLAYPTTTLQAQGGVPPLKWSSTGLPGNLTLNGSGVLSGTPNTAGSFAIVIGVADGAGQEKRQNYTLTVGLPATPSVQLRANKQPTSITDQVSLSTSLGSAYGFPLTGTLALSFTPDAAGLPATGYTAPGLQFAKPMPNTGGLQAAAAIPSGSGPDVQIGSVAGTITVTLTSLTANINGQSVPYPVPSPAPTTTIAVPRLAPVIVAGSVHLTSFTSGGFTLELDASSTPRDLTKATITFTAASGTQLNGTTFEVPLSDVGASWFSGDESRPAGGTFHLQIPFNFSGSASVIGGVTVTLSNSVGSSASSSGGR